MCCLYLQAGIMIRVDGDHWIKAVSINSEKIAAAEHICSYVN